MNIINNNPYRLLGVFANSPQREIIANQGKMKAFLKVGKRVTFPLDLNGLLPKIARSEQSVASAVTQLALPADRMKYAQFWFIKLTDADEIAFGKLLSGDKMGAVDVWEKSDSMSSLQNRIVCALISNQIERAVKLAKVLYTTYILEFANAINNVSSPAASEKIAHDFLDVICANFKPKQYLNNLNIPSWKEYATEKVTKPIIDRILSAIDEAKLSKGKGWHARLMAGTKLMNGTKSDLNQLKQLCQSNSLQYQPIADKLGIEILQCGIDYFNETDESDATQKAITLQSYAESIVVGQMAKDRCKENLEILNKIATPSQVSIEDKAIKAELKKLTKQPSTIEQAISLIENTTPKLRSIKMKLGDKHPYYINISTQIVNEALNIIIAEVNKAQNHVNGQIGDPYDTYSITLLLLDLPKVISSALNAMQKLDTFDMDLNFKANRYDPNRTALHNLNLEIGALKTNNRRDVPTPPISGWRRSIYEWPDELPDWAGIVIIQCFWALIGISAGGLFGFVICFFVIGLICWYVIPINFIGYIILEWIYRNLRNLILGI